VNNTYILADATEILSPYNKIPTRCLNGKGLVVKRNTSEWIELSQNDTSIIHEEIMMEIMPDKDSVNGIFNVLFTSYDALNYRNMFQDRHEEIEKNWNQKNIPNIDAITTTNYSDLSKPYIISFKTMIPVQRIENAIMISPFYNEPIKENPFIQKTRIYPVDMIYPQKREFKSIINFPAVYKLSQVPDNYSVDNQLVTISYNVKENVNQGIEVTAMYQFKKAIYTAKEYQNIRLYYNEIINRFNKQIVLTEN
jgi:hypothetical protein